MTSIEIVTLIGIGLTFIIGVFNLVIAFRNARNSTFINSVTASRIKYIQELRESISRFCALANSYRNGLSNLTDEQHWKLHKEADTLKYLIRLYLNPEDDYWDGTIITLTDKIMRNTERNLDKVSKESISDEDQEKKIRESITDDSLQKTINELITITQYLLKLEWEGAKRESEVGILSDVEKREIYNKYVELHKSASPKK